MAANMLSYLSGTMSLLTKKLRLCGQLKDQQLKLDEARAKKRRKVAIDAQQSFADIEAIKAELRRRRHGQRSMRRDLARK
jgi:hypothetical protein